MKWDTLLRSSLLEKLAEPPRRVALAACGLAVAAGLLLAVLYRSYGGPGDAVGYYSQASDLFPFVQHYYGPLYFVAIRIAHTLTGLEWFTVGKLVGIVSGMVVLFTAYRFLATTASPDQRWMALTLVALNPVFISEFYSTLTIMFGFALLFPAILSLARASSPTDFAKSGLLFGVAALGRFQANGFLLGALVGTAFVDAPASTKIKRGLALCVGFLAPPLVWHVVLLLAQGYAPDNHNFIHITHSLGAFGFQAQEVGQVVARYGSFLGVITSEPGVLPSIALFGIRRLLLFPFREGLGLVFLPAGLLLAGLASRHMLQYARAPWFWSFGVGLFLTGLGSRGQLFYYVPFVPFCAILIAAGMSALASRHSLHRAVLWIAVLGVTIPWSAWQIHAEFSSRNWSEFDQARAYIEESTDPHAVVSSTAFSFAYGLDRKFVDQSSLLMDSQSGSLVAVLRARGITHLVVTERHTFYEFPSLRPLLEDSVGDRWPGLRREMLLTTPQRLGVFRVLPDTSDTQEQP